MLFQNKKKIIFKCPQCHFSIPFQSIYFFYSSSNFLQSIIKYKCSLCSPSSNEPKEISYITYLSSYPKTSKVNCIHHPHNKYAIFNSNCNFYCINCIYETVLPQTYKNKLKYSFLNIVISPKHSFMNISKITKESICIRNVVSLSENLVAYVIDKRIIIWNYITDKIVMSLPECNYISDIIYISNKNKLITYGTSIRIWDLSNVENTKTPVLFTDLYEIVQYAIVLNDNYVAFITEDGLFIWEYEIDDLSNVIQHYQLTAMFLFKLCDNTIVYGSTNKVTICEYNENKEIKHKSHYEDEIFYCKELSQMKFILILKSGYIKICELDKENLSYEIMFEFHIEISNEYWNFYTKELIDGYILLFGNNKDIFLVDPYDETYTLIYSNEHINKIKVIHNGIIGLLLKNESFVLFDYDSKQMVNCFENKSYGKISSFEDMVNGDIIICQAKQEFFYSILALINHQKSIK